MGNLDPGTFGQGSELTGAIATASSGRPSTPGWDLGTRSPDLRSSCLALDFKFTCLKGWSILQERHLLLGGREQHPLTEILGRQSPLPFCKLKMDGRLSAVFFQLFFFLKVLIMVNRCNIKLTINHFEVHSSAALDSQCGATIPAAWSPSPELRLPKLELCPH